jgi:hypothetical protein
VRWLTYFFHQSVVSVGYSDCGHLRAMRIFPDSILFAFAFFLPYSAVFAADMPSHSQQAVKLPLTFETNLGQVDARVQFMARGLRGNFFLSRDGVTMTDGHAQEQSSVAMWFPGSSEPEPTPESATGGVTNYFAGKTRDRWIQHVPMYARVRYHNIFPGIDLIFHGNQDQLEYDFELTPGANPEQIQLAFRGATATQLDSTGSLIIETDHGEIRFLAPNAYQEEKGVRHPIPAAFTVSAGGPVGFSIGAYDHHAKLTIDPVVAYATSVVTSNSTQIGAVAVDTQGDLLFTGETYAPDYPVAGGGKSAGNTFFQEIVLTKLNPAGDTILYSTYIPSANSSTATALAIGQDDSAYIAGITGDPNFPVTSQNLGGCTDFCNAGFVAKFDTTGAMAYSTMLGSQQILPHAIALNAAGNAYVTGQASGDGLLPVNAFQPTYGGAFYAELNTSGDHYVFASYYGVDAVSGQAIALDRAGSVYIAGSTNGDVPSSGQLESGIGGMFLAKFSPDGSHLLFGTNFGGGGLGSSTEAVIGMGVGTDGTVYLAGNTPGPDFPYLITADRLPIGPGQEMFAAAFDPTLTKLKYSTMLGNGFATAAALDTKNNFWVAGHMNGDVILPVNALESDGGPGNGLIFQVNPTGKIVTSTYFGGANVGQIPAGLTVDAGGNVYLGGSTTSSLSPYAQNIDDGIRVGKNPLISTSSSSYSNYGVFLAKIAPDNRPQISLAGTLPYLYLRNVGTSDLHISSIDLGGGLSKTYGSCGRLIPAGHSCALTLGDGNGKLAQGTVTINSDATPPSQTFTPSVNSQAIGGSIGHLLFLDLSQLRLPAQQIGTTSIPAPFRIWNVGVTPATLNSIQVGGSIVETHDCTQTLAAGKDCTVNVSWAPAHSGGNYIQVNADTGQQLSVYAPGPGLQGPDPLYFSQQNMNFGNQLVGGNGLSHEVTVTNISNSQAALSTADISGPSEFAISGNSCTGQLAPHQSCAVSVSFTPAIDGSRTAMLNLSGSGSSASIGLIASGAIASQVTVNPLQLGFDNTVIGGQPWGQQLTLTNTGPGSVSVSGVSFSQPIFSETDNCTAPLPVNGTCAIQVTAKPLQPGNFFGTMTVAFDGTAKSQILTVSGVAYFPITTLVSSLDFGGSTAVGAVSSSQYIEIANSMQTKPQPYTANVTDDFVVDTSKCPSPVPGFWGCPLYVTFQPKTAGLHHGVLSLTFPGVSAVETLSLTGSTTGTTGNSGPVASMPKALDFGGVMLGSSATQSIAISNTGQQLLNLTALSVTGTNAADYSVAAGQCPTIAAGASCILQIGFHPSADVSENAQLSIVDSAPGSPQSVALTGKGIDPVAWAAPPSSTTSTTTSGGTAKYDLSMTSGASFSGNVTITCTGAPQYATCTPNPTSLKLSPGQTASISVAVATSNAATASVERIAPFRGAELAFVFCFPLLALRSLRFRIIGAVGATAFIACVLLGCGGSSGNATPPPTTSAKATPAGTYTLHVVASSGGFSQTQKLTLIVQ